MARSAAQGRKKKTPTKAAPKAAEPVPEQEESTEVVPEEVPTEAAEEAGDDGTEQMATDDLPVTTEDEVSAMNAEEEEEEEGEGEAAEGEEEATEEQAEGGEEEEGDEEEEEEEEEETADGSKATKRKKAQAGNKAKKAKVDEAVCMNVYVTRSPGEKAFNETFQGFLAEQELEVKEITKNDERKWELFGVLELKNKDDKEKFMSLSGTEVGGREVKFEEIKESNIDGLTAPPEKVLFIGNIPKTTTVSDLRNLYPTAKEIFFPMSRHGEKRGFVFIELESKEEVEEMIKTRQGEKLEGNELSVGKYIPKKKNRTQSKKQNGADFKGRFDNRGGRQGSGGFRQGFNRPNFGGGYGGGGSMNFGGGRFMNDYESRLLQSRFGGYGFGGQMGFDGGFGGNMGGGYRSNFNSGNQGGYNQRYQGGRNFKSNRTNRGGRRF